MMIYLRMTYNDDIFEDDGAGQKLCSWWMTWWYANLGQHQ